MGMNSPGHPSALLASPTSLVLGLPVVTRFHPFASISAGVMLAICLRLGVFARFRPGGRNNRHMIPKPVAFEPVINGPIHARLRRRN